MEKCPKCKKHYKEHPAISRVDDKTPICPTCGVAEAFAMIFEHIQKRRFDLKTNSLTPEEERIIDQLLND